MDRVEEYKAKVDKIRRFMDKNGLKGVLLTTQHNFSWLSCGGDNQIIRGREIGFVSFFITGDKVYLVTNNIEMPRVLNEEVLGVPVEQYEYVWTEDGVKNMLGDIVVDGKVASDANFPGTINMESEIGLLRTPLLAPEIERYRKLARMCEISLNETMKEIEVGMEEYEIQGIIGGKLLSKGIYPVVLLVGTDERIFNYRHPMPTEKKLERYCMVVICAQRWGLILNMTRLVYFGKLTDEIKERYEALHIVDMAYITATRVGNRIKDIFEVGKVAYKSVGYEGEEKKHFQGGTCGYLTREQGLDPYNAYEISDGEIFAHNPTITGTKIEDSIMIKNGRYEVLTLSDDWPSREMEHNGIVLKRPEILQR